MVSYVNSGHRKYLAIINERWSHGTLIDEGSETGKCIKGRSLSWWRGGGVCMSTSCSQLQNCHLLDFGHCALAKPCLSLSLSSKAASRCV